MTTTTTGYYELPYATPDQQPRGPRVVAASMIVVAALGLIALGGCFLIGVMLLVTGGFAGAPPVRTTGTNVLMGVLYMLAFASFGGSIALFITGIRALLHIVRG
jgi:hypothetical protein